MAAVDGNETEAFEAFVRTAGPRLLRVTFKRVPGMSTYLMTFATGP